MCVDTDQFKAVISTVERQLSDWKIDEEQRQWFWREVGERYKKAPQLRLDDMTAAAKLYALHRMASEMLAAAAQRK